MSFNNILQRGFLKVAVPDDRLGLSSQDNGQFTGFGVEWAKALAAALFDDPNAVEFVRGDAEDSLQAVRSGQVDLAAADIPYNIANDIAVDFSPVYLHNAQTLIDGFETPTNLALALPENDSQWGDVVRWTVYAAMQAEEFGITSANLDTFTNTTDPGIQRLLGLSGNLGEVLGIESNFAARIVKHVGNYGEMFTRSFPQAERGLNTLWNDSNGGLIYPFPLSGSSNAEITQLNNDDRNLVQEIRDRGYIKLGIEGTSPGFSQDIDGQLVGIDVELGRALAAAMFGDPEAITFTVEEYPQRFQQVADGKFDVVGMGITHNLVRDAVFGIDYSPAYLYDGQGILVRTDSNINTLQDLEGGKIGVFRGTTGVQNLKDYLASSGINATLQEYDTNNQLFDAYDRGEVDAASTDRLVLGIRTLALSDGPSAHRLLDLTLSKEPLALLVDENQSDWGDIVRWVMAVPVQAEKFGITSANVDSFLDSTDPEIRRFLGLEGNYGEALGIRNDFAVQVIKAVGNYEELYTRNFNPELFPRGNNNLYSNSGLQFAPPFEGEILFPDPSMGGDRSPLGNKGKRPLDRHPQNDYFLQVDESSTSNLKFTLTSKDLAAKTVHEVVVFAVDDAEGSINGLLPGEQGYINAALGSGKTIFSVLPDEFLPNPSRILKGFAGQNLSFALLRNSTRDGVLKNGDLRDSILFANETLSIAELSSDRFELSFEDKLGDSLADLILQVQMTNEISPIGTATQGNGEQEFVDLREFSGRAIDALFPLIESEAHYNNTVGFYHIENTEGTVIDPLTGQAIDPGETGYNAAALRNSQERGFVASQSASISLEGGYLFAPFIVVNDSIAGLLNGSETAIENAALYFSFLGANKDGFDHIRLLGDNFWGFEDLPNGGDTDYNDVIIRAEFSVV
ncbi:MAG: transporter substrate-binding domain-containing protein [Spirulina sp.]